VNQLIPTGLAFENETKTTATSAMKNKKKNVTVKNTTVRKLNYISRFLCDQVVRQYEIVCRFRPSIVANACVMLAR
jgi:hypothetical protein